MQTYSNFLSRGLTNNEIQTLHEDSLKGVTVNGEMWVFTASQSPYRVKKELSLLRKQIKFNFASLELYIWFSHCDFSIYRVVIVQFPKRPIGYALQLSCQLRLRPLHSHSACTVFSRLNAPGVYLKLGLRNPAFIWSRRLIGVRRLLMK